MAFVSDDEVEGFNGDGGIVGDGLGQLSKLVPGGGGALFLFVAGGDLAADEHGVEALDGGDADLADGVDFIAGEELGVIEFGELAAVAGGDELLEFVEGLAAEGFAVDQEEDAFGAGEFNEAVDEVAGGEGFAAAGGHLDEGAGVACRRGILRVCGWPSFGLARGLAR